MAYIGAEPLPGQNREVDDISSSFNGSTTAFTLQVNGLNTSPETANNILVNIGGVIQNPGTDYTIAASTITFTTAPAAGLSFFAIILGAGINTATVADQTIGTSKILDNAVTADKLAHTSVTAGSYTTADITVDAQGRITAAASGSISGAEIADNAVTTAKIADSTGASDGVTTAKLATDAVTAAKLASNSVVSDSIVDGSIVNADINASAAIAKSKLASLDIVNADVNSSAAIAGSKISPDFGSQNITTTGTVNAPSIGGGQISGRNVVINGEMLISQRGNDFTGVAATAYHIDRFQLYLQNTSAQFRVRHSADSPDEFHQSLRINCTTADTSLANAEEIKVFHKIEGQNLGRFAKGTSAAKKFTLSFYVKASKAGTYCVELFDRDNSRDVSGSYTVSNTNWNRYTVDFPADTTGAFDFDANSSLEISFWLVAGGDTNTGSLNTTWRSSQDSGSATGQVNFADSTSNEWMLTGVQLEATDNGVATAFEHRSVGYELDLCKRYFNNFGATTATGTSATYMLIQGGFARFGSASSIALNRIPYDVEMRATPTVKYGRNSTNDDNNMMRWSASGSNPIVNIGSQEGSNKCGRNITAYNTNAGQTYNEGAAFTHQISKFRADAEL